jgi:hypothetical protein
MKKQYIFFSVGLFLLIISQSAFGVTPGEVYEKHRREIIQGKINVFEGNVFFVIHSKPTKSLDSKFVFRKMKVKALKNLFPRFLRYRYPDVSKEWFELYYSLPSISKISIKKSFVVDKNIATDQAYLVLTVPEKEIESVAIHPRIAKDAVNRAFDDGTLISLIKYSRVVSGERLKEVKKKIALRASLKSHQENNIDGELTHKVEQPSKSEKETTADDELKKPIDCALPLCEKINKKKQNKDSSKGTTTKDQTKEIFNGTTIRQSNDLDDLL